MASEKGGGWPLLVHAARNAGYGLAVLGSLARDVDVIAVPWREEHDEEVLVDAFRAYPAHVDRDELDWRGWRTFVAVMTGPQGDYPHGRYFDVKVARLQHPSAAVRMLAAFHEHPNALGEGTNTQALRRTLHDEEHKELVFELEHEDRGQSPNLEQIARECADVLYVTYGTAWAYGIDLDAALGEVHRAAMDKMNAGLRREDGKILKPPGFRPPDMTEAIRNAA